MFQNFHQVVSQRLVPKEFKNSDLIDHVTEIIPHQAIPKEGKKGERRTSHSWISWTDYHRTQRTRYQRNEYSFPYITRSGSHLFQCHLYS